MSYSSISMCLGSRLAHYNYHAFQQGKAPTSYKLNELCSGLYTWALLPSATNKLIRGYLLLYNAAQFMKGTIYQCRAQGADSPFPKINYITTVEKDIVGTHMGSKATTINF